MKQYTPAQVAHFREKLAHDDSILSVLDQHIAPVRSHYRVPETALATWAGFYVCPEHSVNLEFDIADPLQYRCPVDGEVFTGAPYEGAWWRLLNANNSVACHFAALRYMLCGDADDLALSRRLLIDYATYYPGYEIHGGIPYNKPGKANAQTLCDAQWIKRFVSAYDIVREALSPADRDLIERDLLRCCADFLMDQRTDQIHNHECIVDSAIGVIGIVLGDAAYLDFAVEQPYGLKYQLRHGLLSDGFWFEGTPSYHFYAMRQFMEYEAFTRGGGAYSFFDDPRFLQALKYPARLTQPDGTLPALNDSGNNGRGFAGAAYVHEMAYARSGDMDFARLLALAYSQRPRQNVDAFFDGVDTLPDVPPPATPDFHAGMPGDSGLTVLHGPEDRYLLIKHSPYGGEHDHYDRLALHFLAMGTFVAPDIGTTQYGAPLHYAYYKNTASHNTVCLNGENQPPANCTVRAFSADDGVTVLDTEVRWDGTYVPLDSFTISQWSDEAYAGAHFRRHVTWYVDCFVDVFDVVTPAPRDIDWTWHVRGTRLDSNGMLPCRDRWADHGAGQYLHDVRSCQANDPMPRVQWDAGSGVRLDVYALSRGAALYDALGPDNPSVSELSYWIERIHGTKARFVHVISAYRKGQPPLTGVTQTGGGLLLHRADGTDIRYTLPAFIDSHKEEKP